MPAADRRRTGCHTRPQRALQRRRQRGRAPQKAPQMQAKSGAAESARQAQVRAPQNAQTRQTSPRAGREEQQVSALSRQRTPVRGGMQALCAAVAAIMVVLCCSASAFGAVIWRLASTSNTTVAPGGQLEYVVQIFNDGDEDTNGADASFTATFPDALTVVSAPSVIADFFGIYGGLSCTTGAHTVTCSGPAFVNARSNKPFRIVVAADPDATGVLTALYDISGGGAPSPAQTGDRS